MRPPVTERVYRKGRTPKIIISVCLIVVAFLLFLNVFAFFYFQRYTVRTDDGIKVVVPWLPEEGQGSPGDRH